MKRLFVLLVLFPILTHAQSCLDDAIAAIQNVDSRGDFVSVQCNPRGNVERMSGMNCQ